MARIELELSDIEGTIILERIDNGYLIRTFTMQPDNSIQSTTTAHVIPSGYQNTYRAHNEALVDMLWEILEAMEEYGSDHHDTVIEIKVKKQRHSA